jgi:hypothetical protein
VGKEILQEANGVILILLPRAFPLKNACGRRKCHKTTGRGDNATDIVGSGALGAGIGHMPARGFWSIIGKRKEQDGY